MLAKTYTINPACILPLLWTRRLTVLCVLGGCAAVEPAVCIVTGASRGIGRAVALALGQAGCKVSC